jgi:uncharacterized protein (DUF305 family)
MKNSNLIASNKLRISAVFMTGLIVIGGLTACSLNVSGDGSMSGMNHDGTMHDSDTDTSRTSVDGEFSSTDIMFAQAMIPHHEQAIEMSALAQTRTTDPEVLALAAKITAEQDSELQQMAGWLSAAGVSDTDAGHMSHDMGEMGMLDEAQMTALAAARGAAFDKLYLKGMIQHHLSAIDMAQMIMGSANAEVKMLGENVVSSQTAEIAQMKTMLGE